MWRVPPDGGHSIKWGEWLPLRPAIISPSVAIPVDLSNLRFVDPLFLIRLRAFMEWHASRGYRMEIARPEKPGVRSYLSRMGVGDDLPDGCAFDVGTVNATPQADVLVPLRKLYSRAEAAELSDELGPLLDAQFPGDLGQYVETFLATIGEMCDNATSHGSSPLGTYVAAQRYQSTRVVLAIGDLGIGIPAHIRRAHPELVDDGAAIAAATRVGLTGVLDDSAAHRGNGYDWVIETMQESRIPNGKLRIWSDRGRFSLQVVDGKIEARRGWRVDEPTQGTWLRLELGM